MKITRRPVIAGMLALGATGIAYAQTSPLDGEWWGLLTYAGTPYRFRIVLDGNSGVLHSVDQGGAQYPLDGVEAGADSLGFRIDAIGVAYRGVVQDGSIGGVYSFVGQSLPVAFQREPIPYPAPVPLDGTPNPMFDGEWHGGGGTQGPPVQMTVAGEGVTLNFAGRTTPVTPDIVAVNGDRIFFRISSIDANYLGTLSDGRIAGMLTQMGQQRPIDFQRTPIEPEATIAPLTQARLDALLLQSGAPGLAAAAAGARNTLNLAAGVRNAAEDSPVGTSDLWQLGSNTKAMTSTLVARLAETGAISWNDTVAGVLGDAIPDIRAEYRDVTLRHLCSHTAFLPHDLPADRAAPFSLFSDDAHADRLAASRLGLALEPVGAEPGRAYAYSNIGYVVAATMLEARIGESWEALLRRHVFEPLGMATADFGAPTGPDQPSAHLVDGDNQLQPLPGEVIPATLPQFVGPAGAVFASLEDVLRFLAAHRDRTSFLTRESWDILHTPPFGGDYAMGWIVRADALWHNGSTGVWYAEMLFDPARGVSAVAACNLGAVRGVTAAVATALAGAAEAVA